MNAGEAREILKWAAGPKTFPISRLLTSPRTSAAMHGLGGAAAGLALLGPLGLALGAPAALAGYGLGRLGRWISARALASRALRGGLLTGSEQLAVRDVVESRLKKSAAKYPFSEFLTSRVVHGAAEGALDLTLGRPPLGLLSGAAGVHIRRAIEARALRGRIAQGGKALYPMEHKAIEMLKEKDRAESIAKLKRLLRVAGVTTAAAGGVYAGAKALSGKSE